MYNLRELSAITDVPVHRIHKWIVRGLVPTARIPSWSNSRRSRYYDQEHVRRIRDVVAILEQNMTLDDIRDRFNPPEENE